MRDIKFRAFYKGKMRDVLCVDWLNRFVDVVGGVIEIPFEEVELMQYTGSKGIDEVPIYEGDGLETADGEFIGIVHFTDGTFMVGDESLWEWDFETKVCGNEFENPELVAK